MRVMALLKLVIRCVLIPTSPALFVQSLRRAAEQAASVADEKRLQVAVLMETVETLHAGSDAEREQRLVSLTAQLAGAKGVQAALERRAAHLQVSSCSVFPFFGPMPRSAPIHPY